MQHMSRTGTRKERPGEEVQLDGCRLAQPKCVRLWHFVFGK